jgi:DNA-binding transcriptional MerR regulator
MMPVDSLWTLDELCEQVAAVLSGQEAATDGRVREVPDRRTVRYYTTLGLLDRPSQMRGRTAYYGRKHLLQLVAIKHLQARGLPLAQVQQQLIGLTEPDLARLAGLPDEPSTRNRKKTRDEAFWTQVPAAPAPAEAPRPAMAQAVRLAPGVLLVVEAGREVRPDDLAAIQSAAVPLVELLRARGLIEDNPG